MALAHRIKLIVKDTNEERKQNRLALLVRACTHPSFAAYSDHAKMYNGQDESDLVAGSGRGVVRTEDSATREIARELQALDAQYLNVQADFHNGSMASLGNSLLGLIASEYLHLRYPNLPNRVLKAALSAYVGPTTLSDVAAELGITAQGIVRWDRDGKKGIIAQRTMSREAFADAMRAIVAVIFQEQGLTAARDFVHAKLLSRLIPIVDLLKFDNPKRSLSLLMRKLGKERPQSRLIAETGRLSINPIFVVGVWSGTEKLGEGTGSAIRMAEFRAAQDALRRFYLSETPSTSISLPSTTLDMELDTDLDAESRAGSFAFKDIWSVDHPVGLKTTASAFQPGPLGVSEVTYNSRS